jgi:sugar/nucleoside kinase (ribokinase family)
VRDELNGLASKGAFIWVDSRRRIERFPHAVLKVNDEESREALQRTGCTDCSDLRSRVQAKAVIVTHGGDGVGIFEEKGNRLVETARVPNPVDICGAGDSFTAGAACAWAAGATLDQAARLGHLVASVTIMKPGTGSSSPQELLEAEQRSI